jgi:predicted dehydrogenase
MSKTFGVGVIGCGVISSSYMSRAPLFRGIEMRACADMNADAAKARADEFGLRAQTVDQLLANDEIDIVVNLTVPDAHYRISKSILEAGKHAYTEKPLVLSVDEGKDLQATAKAKGLRVGSAPDTFLGGAHQFARKMIDDGSIGRVTSGTCHVMSFGMEHWHPNPDFFFKPGGGPILDLGPYYVGNLINLIGPVKRVAAMSSIPSPQRTITSEPRAGEKITVETPTTIHAVLEFANGALVTLGTSWDVFSHGHHNMELYGSEGTIYVPDPNFFGGTIEFTERNGDRQEAEQWEHRLSVPNREHRLGAMADYRSAGLADMAQAIDAGRDHRCSIDRALHAVDVMTSILKSGETGEFVALATSCSQPALLDPDAAAALFV